MKQILFWIVLGAILLDTATVPRFFAIRRLLDRIRSGRSAHDST